MLWNKDCVNLELADSKNTKIPKKLCTQPTAAKMNVPECVVLGFSYFINIIMIITLIIQF